MKRCSHLNCVSNVGRVFKEYVATEETRDAEGRLTVMRETHFDKKGFPYMEIITYNHR
ncbi:MAG: hypothetical protein WC796_03740 [Candidatus Pacearchaeota archaeon]|jgi:hypothetical protein